MKARRGSGEGSIFFDEKKALWTAIIELPKTASGKRHRKYVRAKTKGAVRDELARLRSDLRLGLPISSDRQKVADFLAWWLANSAPVTAKESTVTGYEFVVNSYIVPAIGKVPLSKLSPEMVQTMLNNMEKLGLSPRTRRQTRSILRRALTIAERYGHVARNVAALVDPPKIGETKLDDVLSADEARAILAVADTDPLGALAHLVLGLGPRRGEGLALKWANVDFDEGLISIEGTLKSRKGGGWYVDTPKSRSSTRLLPMTDSIRQSLVRRWHHQAQERQAAGDAWQEHDFVFTSSIGTPVDQRNIQRWWRDLVERAEVKHRRFHATRHTTATLMYEQGIPLEVISAILGHASLAITADVYTNIGDAAKRKAAKAIGDLLAGSPTPSPVAAPSAVAAIPPTEAVREGEGA